MSAEDFAIKDYELKIRYLTDHLSRMWTRFNYMLGIQTAVAGGKFFIEPGKNSVAFIFTGFLFALIWFLLAAQDRYLVELYRKQVAAAFEKIKAFLQMETPDFEKIDHVGQIKKAEQDKEVTRDWHTWRRESISSTKMAAIVPLLFGVLWVVYGLHDLMGAKFMKCLCGQ